MFGNKAGKAPQTTVIGRGAVIEGRVRASGRVQVDGELQGTLEVDGQVSVGPSGRVVGEVIADELSVGGSVGGKIRVRAHLHVAEGGVVKGEARYGSLQVDRGGVIDGNTLHGGADASVMPGATDVALAARSVPPPPTLPQLRGGSLPS